MRYKPPKADKAEFAARHMVQITNEEFALELEGNGSQPRAPLPNKTRNFSGVLNVVQLC